MKTVFENRFGSVVLKPLFDPVPVSNIYGVDIDDTHKFDINTAEKIALITENRGVQIGVEMSTRRCYVLLHASTSMAAVAALESLTYNGETPAHELEAARTNAVI